MCQCRNRFHGLVLCTLMCTLMFPAVPTATTRHHEAHLPEPDPPAVVQPPAERPFYRALAEPAASDTEWTFHKTADNQHPDGLEQQMVWLMNRARTDPTGEGIWLASMDDADVVGAINYFGVNLDLLQAEFAAIQAKPPAAFDVRLYQAARAHSDYLIANDSQSHTDQLKRVVDAGFAFLSYRGNVFSYTRSGIHGHAGFNIDWGSGDATGMQPGRGHRKAIMSIDGDFTNVGLSVVPEADPATGVGPFVTTGNYCSADTSQPNQFDRFLVGTVWRDLNENDQYDPGEGMGGISVRPDWGVYHAVTADSGGYAMPILESGTYTVSFSGPGISGETTRTVAVDSQSQLLDLVTINGGPGGAEAITGSASTISERSARLNGTVNANGQDVDYYFEYGPTTQYGEISEIFSTTTNQPIAIAVSALSPGTLYHFRLVVVTGTDAISGNDRSFETAAAGGSDPPIPPSSSGGGGGGGCFIGSILR
jgi:hypothetical protein